jgi:uncharacterized repeat protein (TIGR03847 family)
MPRRIFLFDPPDRLVADALGEPGRRTFYLQASRGPRTVSVLLEKTQVAALVGQLATLLDILRGRGVELPTDLPEMDRDRDPLAVPVSEEFRAGTISLGWDGVNRTVVIDVYEVSEAEEPDEEAGEPGEASDDARDVLSVRVAPESILAFMERAAQAVSAGRPPCPFCGEPLNPEGHLCPRRNGHVN